MGDFRLLDGWSRGSGGDFAADVRAGLSAKPKHLPCRWLYDEEGALLFDQITRLPEYYIPRAEAEILEAHVGEIVAAFPALHSVVELGSGSAQKTRRILEAFLDKGRLTYVPIDVSVEMLETTSRALAAVYPGLDVVAIAGTYERGLERLAEAAPGRRLLLWLGSNVGNLTRPQAATFLAGVRQRLEPDDAFLMGVDLRKPAEILNLAYDDPAGVTAHFSRNILARINRELRGEFDLDVFAHRARYLADEGRVKIELVSQRTQRVRIGALELVVPFADRESIHTEDSYKYSPEEIDDLASAAGFKVAGRFFDGGRRFCDVLLRP